ncbi:hypothetical protein ACCO45_013164 [Purpureocillium lilacinum]|uniref:Uncharacterized protein n=1 Tax=Purpureocillium lilacinum TaxID=33203 RepID=A0ACC4DA32_PURLI
MNERREGSATPRVDDSKQADETGEEMREARARSAEETKSNAKKRPPACQGWLWSQRPVTRRGRVAVPCYVGTLASEASEEKKGRVARGSNTSWRFGAGVAQGALSATTAASRRLLPDGEVAGVSGRRVPWVPASHPVGHPVGRPAGGR